MKVYVYRIYENEKGVYKYLIFVERTHPKDYTILLLYRLPKKKLSRRYTKVGYVIRRDSSVGNGIYIHGSILFKLIKTYTI